jgi:hypothetical protein
MATKPAQQNIWNSDNVNDTAPNSAKIALGWQVSEAPSSSTFNWFMKFAAKVAAYVLEGVFVAESAGVNGGSGLKATGYLTGAGLWGTGGASNGTGVSGTGGATNGIGVWGDGAGTGAGVKGVGGTTGHGVVGTGGAGGGRGGSFAGTGGSPGLTATSAGAAGAVVTGGGGEVGLSAQSGSSTSEPAIDSIGSINFSNATDVSPTTAITDKLTRRLVTKAWGQVASQPDAIIAGANIASVASTSGASGYMTVTLARAFTTYSVVCNIALGANGAVYATKIVYQSTTAFRIYVFDMAGAIVDPTTVANGFVYDFIVKGNV